MRHRIIHFDDNNPDIIAYALEAKKGVSSGTERDRLKRVLAHALSGELTFRQRQCIMMYYLGDEKIDEIALKLRLSPSTVCRHIKAGERKLKRIAEYYQ